MKRLSANALRDSLESRRPDHDPAEERRLLAAARRGDRAALESITRRLAGSLHRFGKGFCRDPHDAEDVMQEVLVALIGSLERFRGEASLSSWAYVVARNACARRRRRDARHQPLEHADDREAPALPDHAAGPERAMERRQLRAALERSIASLPDSLRDVLMLRDVEGLSARAVGVRLGLSERAVKSRLHRARTALREMLAPHAERGPAHSKHCPDISRALSRFLEGELGPAECGQLESHVAECAACGAICAELRAAVGACIAWREAPAPAQVRRAVRDALRTAMRARASA